MAYIDGFVIPVPTDNKAAYLEFAERTWTIFQELGALSMTEAWGDDVPDGQVTSLPMAVKLEPGETVVYGWIRWPSKEVRDAAWPKISEDPRMSPETNPSPFDGKRMIFGGFEVALER